VWAFSLRRVPRAPFDFDESRSGYGALILERQTGRHASTGEQNTAQRAISPGEFREWHLPAA